jgi:hypothetical protein
LRFIVEGSGFEVRYCEFSFGFGVHETELCWVQGSEFRIQDSEFRVQGSGLRNGGLGCKVEGLGFSDQGSGIKGPG